MNNRNCVLASRVEPFEPRVIFISSDVAAARRLFDHLDDRLGDRWRFAMKKESDLCYYSILGKGVAQPDCFYSLGSLHDAYPDGIENDVTKNSISSYIYPFDEWS